MTQRRQTPKYTAEFRARGVRLFKESRADHASDNAAYIAIAPKLGGSPDSLRAWCRQADRDAGERSGLPSDEKARIKNLERENRELRQTNEILKKGETIFRHWTEDNGRTRILPLLSVIAQRCPRGGFCRLPIPLADRRMHAFAERRRFMRR